MTESSREREDPDDSTREARPDSRWTVRSVEPEDDGDDDAN